MAKTLSGEVSQDHFVPLAVVEKQLEEEAANPNKTRPTYGGGNHGGGGGDGGSGSGFDGVSNLGTSWMEQLVGGCGGPAGGFNQTGASTSVWDSGQSSTSTNNLAAANNSIAAMLGSLGNNVNSLNTSVDAIKLAQIRAICQMGGILPSQLTASSNVAALLGLAANQGTQGTSQSSWSRTPVGGVRGSIPSLMSLNLSPQQTNMVLPP